jgi:hypothetical protein
MSDSEEPKTIIYDATTVHLGQGFLISLGTIAQGLFVLRQYLETLEPEESQTPYVREYNKLFVPELKKFMAFVDTEFCKCESDADYKVMMRFTNGRLPEPVPVKSLFTSHTFRPDLKFRNCMTNMNIILALIHSRSQFGKVRKIPTHITNILNKYNDVKLDPSVNDKLIEHSEDEFKSEEMTEEKVKEALDIAEYFGKYQERCGKLMDETKKLYEHHSIAHKAGLAAQPPVKKQAYESTHPAAQSSSMSKYSGRSHIRPQYKNNKQLDKKLIKKIDNFKWDMSGPEIKNPLA